MKDLNKFRKRRGSRSANQSLLLRSSETCLAFLDEAVLLSKKAADLSPKSTSYLNTLALLYYKQGKYQEAEAAIKKAIKLAPENPLYREGLKQIQKAQGK